MFVLSKLLSAITQPLYWLALWWVIALLLLKRSKRSAVAMLWSGLALMGLLGFKALPDALLRPLENQYAIPSTKEVERHVGIIVLGGALGHPVVFQAHGQVPLNFAAERMTVPLGLMHQHPHMQVVFSGGEGRLHTLGITEAELAKVFYQQQGVNLDRITLEGGSRNTRENAQQVAALLGERCQQPWLLVTSASHMPRSMREFEAVGCKVTAYPVDFQTGESTSWREYSIVFSLLNWQTALHEYLGMLVYRMTR